MTRVTINSIKKILIANRAEIALRVMRTCRNMGISTVAVYSAADARAPHVRVADEAVYIGPAPSKDSYLNIERIIEAAKRKRADAIHPGYGFLSENAEFAEACANAGITFIGPTPEAIRSMGLKTTARKIIAEADVPVVPGYDDDEQPPNKLRGKIEAIGLPILIKASAGGGGKGMRVVRDASEMTAAIESAWREAEKAFGNGTLLLEKYIDRARHIEVQIVGDHHGNLIHLFERECSIQRRHQKIIEESPSPSLDPELRRQICDAAIVVGRTIGYTNAGTVEFVVAPSGEFYFIEVNTRLQVEHPVTEMITGLDLVRLQIEIAEGKALTLAQEHVQQEGHAIEARLYAEDPYNDFLPAIGTILEWDAPEAIDGLRIDTGVSSGTEIGIHYDPMLAKIIACARDRDTARNKLRYGLERLFVAGVQTNRDFLLRVINDPIFAGGNYHTQLIDSRQTELTKQESRNDDGIAVSVVALYLMKQRQTQSTILPRIPAGFRNNPFRDPSVKLQIGTETFEISWRLAGDDAFTMSTQDWQANVRLVSFEAGKISVTIDDVLQTFRIAVAGEEFYVQHQSTSRIVKRLSRYPQSNSTSEHESAYAPMPGQVLKVVVEVGQHVKSGEALVILEAMKMEQTLRAIADGVVESILVKQGDVVAPGDRLVEIAAFSRD
jgi:3-methylcrotonyl-CoA carboxylase alpha subunit/geranyl-CoA carboxylase alpha subunit